MNVKDYLYTKRSPPKVKDFYENDKIEECKIIKDGFAPSLTVKHPSKIGSPINLRQKIVFPNRGKLERLRKHDYKIRINK